MPTKGQAKTAIDQAAVALKADIDNTLPTGVSISDGRMDFNPMHWTIILDAQGDVATAEALVTAILAALRAQSRQASTSRYRRGTDGLRIFSISTTLAEYRIINF